MADAESRERARLVAEAAIDAKAQDLVVLDVAALTLMCDCFVIATGTSDRHVRSVCDRIEDRLQEHGVKLLHREGERQARWILLDYGDVVVHLFDPEAREFYGLEQLWADAPRIDVPLPA